MKKAVIFDMYGVLVRRNFFIAERENDEVVAIVKELKERGVRLFLLSNIFIWDSAHFLRKFPSLQLFEKCYFSSDTGLAKPSPAAYQKVLEENGLNPEDCVFFDDTRANVEGAKALGIETHVFEDVTAVRKVLGM
ncbi:MAG TPA: HAD-IA family hydrolase [Candidatus Paceibacterota bacterium]|nr:HAD-IA family hydrolase [Candidatus Paceibacterota bacterium]